jgi:hypothetical protein
MASHGSNIRGRGEEKRLAAGGDSWPQVYGCLRKIEFLIRCGDLADPLNTAATSVSKGPSRFTGGARAAEWVRSGDMRHSLGLTISNVNL